MQVGFDNADKRDKFYNNLATLTLLDSSLSNRQAQARS